MAVYIAAEQIKESTNRLNQSRAGRGLADFLVLKRALKLAGANKVMMAKDSAPFQQAIKDITATNDSGSPTPFLKVFGLMRAGMNYYINADYWSNGAADTIAKWHDVVSVEGKPRVVALLPSYLEGVKRRFTVKEKKGELPTLFDAAVWFYRTTDLEGAAIVTQLQTLEEAKEALIGAFKDAVGLLPAETQVLFDNTIKLELDVTDWRSPDQADPSSYIPPAFEPGDGAQEVGEHATDSPETVNEAPKTYVFGEGEARCPLLLTVAAAAKPFVILTGPSGTGKSRGVFRLSRCLETSKEAPHLAFVSVGADWTDMRNLLGYKNPFGPQRNLPTGATYETYEITDALRLLLRAAHPSRGMEPHFLLLDEMNLSHVERYFSAFLAVMEANKITGDDPIPLVSKQDLKTVAEVLEDSKVDPIAVESAKALVNNPASKGLILPPNVFIFGTVNVDETTYMFSPKVLDRAHVLEMGSVSPGKYLGGVGVPEQFLSRKPAMKLLQNSIQRRKDGFWEQLAPATALATVAEDIGLPTSTTDEIKQALTGALDGTYKLLNPVGFGFAYRTVNEIFAYVATWLEAQKFEADEPVSGATAGATEPDGTAPVGDEAVPTTSKVTAGAEPASTTVVIPAPSADPTPTAGEVPAPVLEPAGSTVVAPPGGEPDNATANTPSPSYAWMEALDHAILQKVLPKIHGNRRLLGECLPALVAFLLGNDRTETPAAKYQIGDATEEGIEPGEKLLIKGQMGSCRDKLARMQRRLDATGYTTFVE